MFGNLRILSHKIAYHSLLLDIELTKEKETPSKMIDLIAVLDKFGFKEQSNKFQFSENEIMSTDKHSLGNTTIREFVKFEELK